MDISSFHKLIERLLSIAFVPLRIAKTPKMKIKRFKALKLCYVNEKIAYPLTGSEFKVQR